MNNLQVLAMVSWSKFEALKSANLRMPVHCWARITSRKLLSLSFRSASTWNSSRKCAVKWWIHRQAQSSTVSSHVVISTISTCARSMFVKAQPRHRIILFCAMTATSSRTLFSGWHTNWHSKWAFGTGLEGLLLIYFFTACITTGQVQFAFQLHVNMHTSSSRWLERPLSDKSARSSATNCSTCKIAA